MAQQPSFYINLIFSMAFPCSSIFKSHQSTHAFDCTSKLPDRALPSHFHEFYQQESRLLMKYIYLSIIDNRENKHTCTEYANQSMLGKEALCKDRPQGIQHYCMLTAPSTHFYKPPSSNLGYICNSLRLLLICDMNNSILRLLYRTLFTWYI